MTRTVRLRPWQHAALATWTAHPRPDFLAVATPGAGKTTFALTALRAALAQQAAPVVVVAPTAHLRDQWTRAAARFAVHLDSAWSPANGPPAADMHGLVTTYQQVAASPGALRQRAAGALVVLDEIHHAGDEQAWGAALVEAFGGAAHRLLLSGTPFRSDRLAIPFVRYVDQEVVPDFTYGYEDALRDGGVVRPIYFPRLGGQMEWSAPDGTVYEASFDDPLATQLANQRLRTALSLEGEWLPAVLREAVDRLRDIRRADPSAGGLVIASDQEHARGIGDLLRWRFGVEPVVATSDDPSASTRINAFRDGVGEWLVCVKLVSEGVDAPRLRVGVYASTTLTELFFRQVVGRFVRWQPGLRDQRAWLHIPDDPRLRLHASRVAEERRHSLRREAPALGDSGAPPERELVEARASETWSAEQLSLFAPLSAVATGRAGTISPWLEVLPTEWSGRDTTIEVELAPLPRVLAGGDAADNENILSRRHAKDELRLANAGLVRDLVRQTGWSHARVNGELNRLSGVQRINDATVQQLEMRLRQAEGWLKRLRAASA